MLESRNGLSTNIMEKLVVARTLACFILAVILSIDLLYIRDKTISCVVTDILTAPKQNDKFEIINLRSSEVSSLDVTAETLKRIKVGERIEIYKSIFLLRTVSIEKNDSNISQRLLLSNIIIFILNILAITGFIEGMIKIMLRNFRSKQD